MNVLNWFHPIGVEVSTVRLRAHVLELSALTPTSSPVTPTPSTAPGTVIPRPT